METVEFKVPIPEGMEIDKENSTFECIKFKPIPKKWRYDESAIMDGFYISQDALITAVVNAHNVAADYNIFATEKQAKSAIAMARISQIIDNDDRFGGVITDEEWNTNTQKHCIEKIFNAVSGTCYAHTYSFLAFHTEEQRDLFLEENEDLVKDYFMIE